MQDSDQLPVDHYEPRPFQRRHTGRYYAHLVRESLTTRVSKIICAIFLSLVLIFGIVTFILWLSLRPHRPRFFIHEFSVPGLGQSTGFENAKITFNVTVRNSNQHIGIYYDSMDGLVYYKDQIIGSTPLMDPFYQEPKSTLIVYKEISGVTLTVNSQSWTEFLNDLGRGSVAFHLAITSAIRFKVSTWNSKRHRMHADCDLAVGPNGNILPASKDKKCPVYFT